MGKIPWRRVRQPTPISFPRESPWTEEPPGLQSMGLKELDTTERLKHIISYPSLYNNLPENSGIEQQTYIIVSLSQKCKHDLIWVLLTQSLSWSYCQSVGRGCCHLKAWWLWLCFQAPSHMCRLNVHAGCWLDSSAASYVGLYLGLLAMWQCAILRTKIWGREEKGEGERQKERLRNWERQRERQRGPTAKVKVFII